MAITFTASTPNHNHNHNHNHGLDTSVTPPWQMVPVRGKRVLTLTGVGALQPVVRHPRVLHLHQQVAPGGRVQLTLEGMAAGRTFVDWVANPTAPRPAVGFTLEVSVKAKKIVRTAFHYVSDGQPVTIAGRETEVP